MSDQFVSFVIPTIGRETLARTLTSIVNQTDSDWNAIVIVDSVPGVTLPIEHPRIHMLRLGRRMGDRWEHGNSCGFVRNYGVGLSMGRWIGFVDDDDRIDTHYVEWLREESKESDLVIFRMRYSDTSPITPPADQLGEGLVGISFAIRSEFQYQNSIWFDWGRSEDWRFVDSCIRSKARVRISDRVGYYVRY